MKHEYLKFEDTGFLSASSKFIGTFLWSVDNKTLKYIQKYKNNYDTESLLSLKKVLQELILTFLSSLKICLQHEQLLNKLLSILFRQLNIATSLMSKEIFRYQNEKKKFIS